MPNIEQLEAEKIELEHDYNNLEKRCKRLETENDQYATAFIMIVGAMLGYSLGLLISAFCHWLEE